MGKITGFLELQRLAEPSEPVESRLKHYREFVMHLSDAETSAQGARYNHADQLYEWFPELRGKLDSLYYPDANHTFTGVAQQTALISAVTDWCQRRFPTDA